MISRWIILKIWNLWGKVVEKIKTHILYSVTFSRKSYRLWDNVEKYVTARQATDDNIIRRMRFACWITKATDTHSEYAILIVFPQGQSLLERGVLLRLYRHCLCCLLYTWFSNNICFIGLNILSSPISSRTVCLRGQFGNARGTGTACTSPRFHLFRLQADLR
jgi:hypothetical protein